jgi:hypothetical protein
MKTTMHLFLVSLFGILSLFSIAQTDKPKKQNASLANNKQTNPVSDANKINSRTDIKIIDGRKVIVDNQGVQSLVNPDQMLIEKQTDVASPKIEKK